MPLKKKNCCLLSLPASLLGQLAVEAANTSAEGKQKWEREDSGITHCKPNNMKCVDMCIQIFVLLLYL